MYWSSDRLVAIHRYCKDALGSRKSMIFPIMALLSMYSALSKSPCKEFLRVISHEKFGFCESDLGPFHVTYR